MEQSFLLCNRVIQEKWAELSEVSNYLKGCIRPALDSSRFPTREEPPAIILMINIDTTYSANVFRVSHSNSVFFVIPRKEQFVFGRIKVLD